MIVEGHAPVPDRKGDAEVSLLVPRLDAVVDLVLGGADQDPTEVRAVGQPQVRAAEVAAEKGVGHAEELVGPDHHGVGAPGDGVHDHALGHRGVVCEIQFRSLVVHSQHPFVCVLMISFAAVRQA